MRSELRALVIGSVLALLSVGTAAAETQTFSATKDTFVWNEVPDINIGGNSASEVGRETAKNVPVGLKRGLLHFDISALPPSALITGATLRLFIQSVAEPVQNPSDLSVTVSRLSADFVEGDGSSGVTWNTQPGVETSPTSTADMDGDGGDWFEMDASAIAIAEWESEDPTNVLIRISPTAETPSEDRYFGYRTKEHGTGTDRAQLVIDYVIPTPTPTVTPTPAPPAPTPTDTPTSTPTPTPGEPTLPPDPADVAPALDETVPTDIFSATEFLYAGQELIQTGVAPGTIDPVRVGIIRGHVRTRDGLPLTGVMVSILDHPEYGQTLTRADGMFDLAINGGGLVTVAYRKNGFIEVHRQVDVPWRDFVWAADVVMIGYDAETTVDLATTQIQVARGSVVDDDDGPRQATLLFMPETAADLILPSGTPIPVTSLTVSATEYTVGDDGPDTMPAALPPTSGYTYAVELSALEARAMGAVEVRFSEPVIFYVENFLNFPVGELVPAGYYDRIAAAWVPSDNGHVINLVGEDQGLAEVDTDGDGSADSALNLSPEEREQLALLYNPAQYPKSLWRVPISHFTPWDCNWPFGPPEDAEEPDSDFEDEDEEDEPCLATGSVIGCENQTLGESIGISGTPVRLSYQSSRHVGRSIARATKIRLSGSTVPASLKRIDLVVTIDGRRFEKVFPNPTPNLETSFPWEGLDWDAFDAYRRLPQGERRILIDVGYVYDGVYDQSARDTSRAFGQAGRAEITGSLTREEITIWRRLIAVLDSWDARSFGLGGWQLDVHHVYDTDGRALILGSGASRSARWLGQFLITLAGGGSNSGEGVPVADAQIGYPGDLAVGPDGTIYVVENDGERDRVRVRYIKDGLIWTLLQEAGGRCGDFDEFARRPPYFIRPCHACR